MRRIFITGVLALGALTGSAPPVHADEAQQIKRLKASVIRLQHQVRTVRHERDVARVAASRGLAPQVSAMAAMGSLGLLRSTIFEPIRAAWPCGGTVYQGTSFWSLDVELKRYESDTETYRSCGG